MSSFKQIGEQKLILGFKGLNITFCCLCYHYYEIAELEFPLFLFKLLTGHGSTFHVLRSNNDFSAIDDDYITNENTSWNSFRWITFKHWWKFTANIRSVYLLSETSDQLPTSALSRAQSFWRHQKVRIVLHWFSDWFLNKTFFVQRTHQYNVEDHFVTFYFLHVHQVKERI